MGRGFKIGEFCILTPFYFLGKTYAVLEQLLVLRLGKILTQQEW
jgi:hypothetical protein